jgi:hypothetical protein
MNVLSETEVPMKRGTILVGLMLLGFSTYAVQPRDTQPKPDARAKTSTVSPSVSGGGVQGSSAKPAWEWSDEERIRMRFDPASIRERATAHAAALPPYAHVQAQSAGAPGASQRVIDGSRDPGLFLPAELLDALLEGLHSNASFRTHARDALARDIRGMGYSENGFWNKLEQLSAPYRALTSRPKNVAVKHVTTPDGKTASFLIDVDRCVARHNLLQSARIAFGPQAFQRFLYTAVAPQVWSSEGESAHGPDRAQELIFVAGGCRQ